MNLFERLKQLLEAFSVPGREIGGSSRNGRQAAAIALRDNNGACEVLLVTSRDTGRWIVPKGWIEPGEDGAAAARREAWEEAGVRGDIAAGGPLGSYLYVKESTRRDELFCEVDVYLMRTASVESDWPEKGKRKRRWFPVASALEVISDHGLRPVLRQAVLAYRVL